MSSPDDKKPAFEDYKCELEFQGGWIDLTVRPVTRNVADELAAEAVEEFNPLQLKVSKSDLRKEIARLALLYGEDGSVLTSAYYSAEGFRFATLEVNVYGEDGVQQPTPADVQPMLLDWSNLELASKPDIKYLDLAVGPAVRTQATYKTKGFLGFGRRLVEIVRYAVCPTVVDDVVVLTVRWEDFAHSDFLQELTDELIPTLTLVPLDEHGNEIDPGLLR